MASSVGQGNVSLSENDIPGASLAGRKPEELKNEELKFWLKCRGDVAKGLKTKAQLVKRIYEYIKSGKDKDIVDPDPNSIYLRRKERQVASNSNAIDDQPDEHVEFPANGWGTSLEKMPLFTRAEMNNHVVKSGKRLANKDYHSVPTNLRKAKRFLDDEYLEDIECMDDEKYFYFRAKCCHSFKKNDPSHKLKLALCIVSGEVKKSMCSCVAGKVGFCNHVLALMFKLCKFSLFDCQRTTDLYQEEDQQPSTSSTSLLQKWHRKGGGSNIAPEPVMEVLVKKVKMEGEGSKCAKPLLYEARAAPNHSEADENALKANFFNLNSNVGFAHLHNNSASSETKETKFGRFKIGSCLAHQVAFTESNFKAVADISSVPRALVAIDDPIYPQFPQANLAEMVVPRDLSSNESELIDRLSISELEINKLEKETRQQNQSTRWRDERKHRFTASNFHVISRRQRNHDTFAESLMNPKQITTRNFEHGRRYEPIALMAYEKFMFNRHTPVQVLKCGLVVDKGFPILGASPDARIIDSGCLYPYGIAEVKCPITKFNVTPLEACTDSNFFMEKSGENECKVKVSHPYYAQVQGQLGVTGAQWCDFIVYTKVGLYVQRITPHVQFWEEMKSKLLAYYFGHFIKFASSSVGSASSNSA